MNNRTSSRSVKGKEIDSALADFLDSICDNRLLGFKLSNTASLRRVLFFREFLTSGGNATRAAIMAGYSPRSAKQQGYKILKWLQKETVKEIRAYDYSSEDFFKASMIGNKIN